MTIEWRKVVDDPMMEVSSDGKVRTWSHWGRHLNKGPMESPRTVVNRNTWTQE